MRKKSTSQSAFFNFRILAALLVSMTGISLALFAANPFGRSAAAPKTQAQQKYPAQKYARGNSIDFRALPPGFDCSKIHELGIDRAENLRAGMLMIACGAFPGGRPSPDHAFSKFVKSLLPSPLAYGGTDVDLITGTETSPNIVQSETYTTANPDNPDQIMVAYNDSRGINASPQNISGASVSLDGGITFTRLTKANGQSPFDNTFGDPVILYHRQSGTWVTVWLDNGCGGCGFSGCPLGGYKSTNPSDPNSWTHFCIANNNDNDRESGWADNDPNSPFFGRLYVSWNNFDVGGGALMVTFSTDTGATWHSPITVSNTATFMRDVQITGDLVGNGNVYIAGMDEHNGGFPHNDTNHIFKSTDGGLTWSHPYTGPDFPGPGVTSVGYFAQMFNANGGYWRHEGWGEPAVYNDTVHLVYAQHGTGSDPGDVYYIRSTDGGSTFSAPFKLNSDATTRPQWQPNLSVSPTGNLLATWYDARESTDSDCQYGNPNSPCYRMWSRKSNDNGANWLPDDTLSDVVSPLPSQNDPGIQPTYAGDYDYGTAILSKHLTSWTDGRVAINNTSQQNAFTDRDVVGFSVTTTDPQCGSLVTGTAPTDFTVNLSDPADPSTVQPGDFTVNGTPANTANLSNGDQTIDFIFDSSPVTTGSNTMHIDAGAIHQASNNDPILEFDCTFNYTQVQLAVTDTVPPVGGTFTPAAPGTYPYDVNWNKAVDPTSVATTDLQLSGNTGATVTNVQVTNGGMTTEFTLNIPFGGPLTADIAAGAITDTDGNPNAAFNGSYTVEGCPPSQYTITPGTDAIVAGDTDIGNHTDDGTTFVSLPFSFTLYDQTYNGVNVSSNGNAQFVTTDVNWVSACLPWINDFTIFPLWTDQCTDNTPGACNGNNCTGCGIFTSVQGSAGSRIFTIEWRTALYGSGATSPTENYELRLYEGSPTLQFDIVYGNTTSASATQMFVGGVQGNSGAGFFTQDFCLASTDTPPANVSRTYEIPSCSPTPTPTPGTPTPTPTPTTPTPTPTPTTPTPTPTATATATPTPRVTPRPRPTPHPRPTPP